MVSLITVSTGQHYEYVTEMHNAMKGPMLKQCSYLFYCFIFKNWGFFVAHRVLQDKQHKVCFTTFSYKTNVLFMFFLQHVIQITLKAMLVTNHVNPVVQIQLLSELVANVWKIIIEQQCKLRIVPHLVTVSLFDTKIFRKDIDVVIIESCAIFILLEFDLFFPFFVVQNYKTLYQR